MTRVAWNAEPRPPGAVRVLASLRYEVPDQDLSYSLRRIPTRPRSGFVLVGVRPA
jgi:hypothetical protein